MPASNGHYDEALLGSAPKPNRGQMQEGYDPKLLEDRNVSSTTPVQEKLLPVTAPSDPELGNAVPRTTITNVKSKPFWRTVKGMIIIAAIFIAIIIAAVVGGVVGSRNNKNNNNNTSSAPANGDTASPATQASGPEASGQDGNVGPLGTGIIPHGSTPITPSGSPRPQPSASAGGDDTQRPPTNIQQSDNVAPNGNVAQNLVDHLLLIPLPTPAPSPN